MSEPEMSYGTNPSMTITLHQVSVRYRCSNGHEWEETRDEMTASFFTVPHDTIWLMGKECCIRCLLALLGEVEKIPLATE